MVWIAALFIAGASYNFVNQFGFIILATLAAFIPLFYLLTAIMWVNDTTGLSAFMVGSFQFLSGVSTPGEVVVNGQDCPVNGDITTPLLKMVLYILLAAVALLFIPLGLCVIAGLPVGVFATAGGSIVALSSRGISRELLRAGLGALTIGLGAMVAAGLLMRLLHIITGAMATWC